MRFWFWCLFFLCLSVVAEAKVVKVEIYRQGAFLEEAFPLKDGPNRICLLGRASLSEMQIKSQGTTLLSLNAKEEPPQNELYLKLKRLEREKDALLDQERALGQKLSLLEDILKNKDSLPSPQDIREYFRLFDELRDQKRALEEKRKEIERQIEALRKKLAAPIITCLEVESKGAGKILVRYPAGPLLSYRESYRLTLKPLASKVTLTGEIVLKQRSGTDWQGVKLYFYPRSKALTAISPPPFKPWYLDLPSRLGLVKSKLSRVAEKVALRLPTREKEETGLWEHLVLKGVDLPNAKEVFFPLLQEDLPVERLVLEVPIYAQEKAYFRADLKPDFSLAKTRASFYLEEDYLGRDWVGPWGPGEEVRLYFGEATLLEVKREILKDTTGHPFFSRHREIIEKEFKTTLKNHYQRPLKIELVDRRPIPRHREIKVEIKADPPWTRETSEGKLIWEFLLGPGEEKSVFLSIKIDRPQE